MARTRVIISDALIIKACNSPGGIVAKDLNETGRRTRLRAFAISPWGDPQDKGSHEIKVGGTYAHSFETSKEGSNGHILVRTITNKAPYASIVEFGRRSTVRRGGWEVYSTKWRNGEMLSTHGTRGWEGMNVLSRAFKGSIRKYQVSFVKGGGA
jgi:hypothetical protein